MNPSASSIPRLLKCLGSIVLPTSDYRTAAADQGAENHAEMEAAADVGDIDALPKAVRDLVMPGDVFITETSFAYDVATDTGRKLGGSREYSDAHPFEIVGTPDLVIRGNRTIVVDYKNYEEVDEADANAQTATYALMVARTFGDDEVMVVIVYLGGLHAPSIATLSALDLDAHAARLKKLHADAATARARIRDGILPALESGKHCKYCPSFVATDASGTKLCPLWQQTAQQTASIIPIHVESLIPFEDDEQAAEAMEILERIDMIRTRLKAAIMARAAARPIRKRNGMMFGPVAKLGNREIDANKAYEVIRERWGQAVADDALERKAVQARIVEAFEKHGVKSPKATKDRLVKELEASGAVKREKKTAIEEYEPETFLKAVNE